MTQFPPNPHDGQQLVVPNDEGVCIYTYDAATNSWGYKVYAEAGNAHVTYTDQVLVREQSVEPATQADANRLIVEKYQEAGVKLSDRIENLEQAVRHFGGVFSTGVYTLPPIPEFQLNSTGPQSYEFMVGAGDFTLMNLAEDVAKLLVSERGGRDARLHEVNKLDKVLIQNIGTPFKVEYQVQNITPRPASGGTGWYEFGVGAVKGDGPFAYGGQFQISFFR